jgi:hypothetical protein
MDERQTKALSFFPLPLFLFLCALCGSVVNFTASASSKRTGGESDNSCLPFQRHGLLGKGANLVAVGR